MALDWLRARLLLAIPITVGCGGTPGHVARPHDGADDEVTDDDADDDADPVEAAELRPDVPAPADPYAGYLSPDRPERCAQAPDTLFEAVCGDAWRTRGTCEPTAAGLVRDPAASGTLYVTDPYGDLRRFRFDLDRTDRYRMAHDGKGCCYVRCTTLDVAAAAGSAFDDPPRGYHPELREIPAPPGGTTRPAAGAPDCPAAVRIGKAMQPFATHGTTGRCAYRVFVRDPVYGRPARIEGAPCIADLAAGDAWTDDVRPRLDGLDPALRAALAAAWTDAARLEHASIAAFSNLALQLLAHGAPPALLEATHAAALDELRHARIAFALASAYAGRALGPAAFPEAARMPADAALAALAVETFVDGCLGEACAAAEADHAAARAHDPAIAAVLAAIAADEARHAELAWRVVAWCVGRTPELATVLRAELAAAPPDVAPCDPRGDGLERHGFPGPAVRARLRGEIAEIAAGCLDRISGRSRP